MQVSLDAINWKLLSKFETPEEFIEYICELDNEEEHRALICSSPEWYSDSATQYFEVASALAYLAEAAEPDTSRHLREGIQRLISEDGHVDEFQLLEPSEGCYWISASPPTVVAIKSHIDALDLDACVSLLREDPARHSADLMADLERGFVSFIRQHVHVVDLAASKGFGLLGHCG